MHKVLVIAYYWPPAGGPGVQRWLKFVKYFKDFEVEPIVYVPENPHYPIVDTQLLLDVPQDVKILKRPIREPYVWASLLSKKKTKTISSGIIQEKKASWLERILLWIRGNFFIPDARKSWVRPSITYLQEIIEKEGVETIITTGPPHSLHLIGLGLKKTKKLQWIADFRDPWTTIGYHKKLLLTKKSQLKHKSLETEVLCTADKIVVTSNTTKKEFEQITQKPIKVITNGFDELLAPTGLDTSFTISHLGSLLTGRNPVSLWKALQDLVTSHPDFGKSLKIQLAGVVGEEVHASISKFGLKDYVDMLGYLSHSKVVEVQQKSQSLLLLEIDSEETKGIIPGKLFEYLNAKRPILAIGPDEWEAGDMIEAATAGKVVGTNDVEGLKSLLLTWFEAFKSGKLECNPVGIHQYHRKELTKQMANFIQWESS
ncbi:glycosyl transferase family 1 [Flagellimonas flava]|uniref:Glycosyl transferase family 1 n=1 Tax=Flagellimonas flava TaxID=570519 RepID=A0A1M5J0W3_9FLAO|nr:glycosyl transferase family 1 [Allomuricauda flava]SHG34015.1 hypothetical protein SAMN04488116_1043 [Allomuricauda flava]